MSKGAPPSWQLKNPGFTLIEMLVALAIGASIATVAYSALQGVIQANDKIVAATALVDDADRVWQYLEQDLGHALPRLWTHYQGDRQSALAGVFGDRLSQSDVVVADEEDYLLRLIRGNRDNLSNLPRSHLMIVGYRLTQEEDQEGKTLWRDQWAPVDASEEPRVQQRQLLSGIDDLRLSYCAKSLRLPANCDSGWPSGEPGTLSTDLPAMVQVNLTTAVLGEVERWFNLATDQ